MNGVISLKTLNGASAQDVFNQVASHLMTQKEKSLNDNGTCAYRGLNGLKCAAGCLIADDEYDSDIEGGYWQLLANAKILPSAHCDLVYALQTVHDAYDPMEWEYELQKLCAELKLEWQYKDKT